MQREPEAEQSAPAVAERGEVGGDLLVVLSERAVAPVRGVREDVRNYAVEHVAPLHRDQRDELVPVPGILR